MEEVPVFDVDGEEYLLRTSLVVPEDRDKVFAFFADARNLDLLTPPWLKFHIIDPDPTNMFKGKLIDYRLRLHGVPLRWRSEITEWNPPHSFVDEQRVGPYKRWHHRHIFEEHVEGTVVEDVVHYRVPVGPVAHPLFVRPNLRRIFRYRLAQMKKIFGQDLEAL